MADTAAEIRQWVADQFEAMEARIATLEEENARLRSSVLNADDIEACIRLIDGMSLPADMQTWRGGLVDRLRKAVPWPDTERTPE